MLPVGGISGKYVVGRMAEIMMECNKRLSKMQADAYNVSLDVEAMNDIPAVCKSRSTCFGDNLPKISKKTVAGKFTSFATPPGPKTVHEPRLKKIYQKLEELEGDGRFEWLEVFMYNTSYMKFLRPLERGKWDEPKKFVQRQTLILDGPYPGISNDLIMPANESSPEMHSEKCLRKPSTDYFPDTHSSRINIQNMQLNNLTDEHREFLLTSRPGCPSRSLSKYKSKDFNCDCLKSGSSEIGRKRSIDKFVNRRKYVKKYDYCLD